MTPSQACIDFIKGFESCAESIGGGMFRAYRDPVGILTIGWGHTGADVTEGLTWTQQQCDDVFTSDLNTFAVGVNNLVTVALNQNQYDAVVSFSFNVGLGALRKSTLLRLLNAGDFAGASEQFPLWNKAGGVVLSGLVRRRADEQAMFNSAETAQQQDIKEETAIIKDEQDYTVIDRDRGYKQTDLFGVGDTVRVISDTTHGKKYGTNTRGQKFRNSYTWYNVYGMLESNIVIGRHPSYTYKIKPFYVIKI